MRAEYIAHMGDDLLVANAARVSFSKHHQQFEESDGGLLRYLAAHNHWTPFAHPHICLRVTAPVFIRTQCYKHKIGFVENEVSRRYVADEPEVYLPAEWRGKAENKKQGSAGPVEWQVEATAMARWLCDAALNTYRSLLALGIAPEQARLVLPQGMETTWYWTGSLMAYGRFYRLRVAGDAQREIGELAEMIGGIIGPLFPVSWPLLVDGGL